MQKLQNVFRVFFISVCLLWSSTAAAEQAMQMMEGLANELIASLKKNKEVLQKDMSKIVDIVDTIIMPHTDFELIGKRVLGPHWRNATAEQRKAFLKEFKLLLIVTYAAAFRSYEDQTVEFTGERADPNNPNRVEVRTLIKSSGAPPIPVNYRLHKVDGSCWLVYDFNVDGVGLTSSFRSQFNNAINQKGIDQVVAEMKVKNDEVFNI
jgi:phospholipid transport system substrate-binding protein